MNDHSVKDLSLVDLSVVDVSWIEFRKNSKDIVDVLKIDFWEGYFFEKYSLRGCTIGCCNRPLICADFGQITFISTETNSLDF